MLFNSFGHLLAQPSILCNRGKAPVCFCWLLLFRFLMWISKRWFQTLWVSDKDVAMCYVVARLFLFHFVYYSYFLSCFRIFLIWRSFLEHWQCIHKHTQTICSQYCYRPTTKNTKNNFSWICNANGSSQRVVYVCNVYRAPYSNRIIRSKSLHFSY